jgi:hypothetical protein
MPVNGYEPRQTKGAENRILGAAIANVATIGGSLPPSVQQINLVLRALR